MILGIDTSGAVSTALVTDAADAAVLARFTDERARHHDEVLMELIDRTLATAGASRSDVTAVVAGTGPGPFTGLRVGLVTARSIAAVLNVPLRGLCSLDGIAQEAAAEIPPDERSAPVQIAVALDARRQEIYHARYELRADGSVQRTHGPAVNKPAEVAAELRECTMLAGSGCALYPELLPATSSIQHTDAAYLIAAAQHAQARGEDLSSTAPLYLREPDAAKPTARKSALGA